MKKKALTLLEIMIVIFLITLITGTLGYSMRGSLDQGRAFRTEQGKAQLYDLLQICLADKGDIEAVAAKPLYYLQKLGLAKDPQNLLKDGWKQEFQIKVSHNDFVIQSDALDRYYAKKKNSDPS